MLVDLSLGFLFWSIDLYFCLCANTILSWWLWLCSIFWSQAGWFLQFHSSLALFSKHTLWSVYLEHAQRKDGNQQNRTKTYWCQGMFSFCSDVLPNIIDRAKNHLVLFIYRIILCTQAYNFFLLRSFKNNAGHVSKALHPRIWKGFTDMTFSSTN